MPRAWMTWGVGTKISSGSKYRGGVFQRFCQAARIHKQGLASWPLYSRMKRWMQSAWTITPSGKG